MGEKTVTFGPSCSAIHLVAWARFQARCGLACSPYSSSWLGKNNLKD